jgi:hypothetical protein
MLLYLNLDSDYSTGWMGNDCVVNRKAGDRTTTLEKNVGGKYEWTPVALVAYQTRGNELVIQISRSTPGVIGHLKQIDFKWADHCFQNGDWTDFTLIGDAAPNDRFNCRAKLE